MFMKPLSSITQVFLSFFKRFQFSAQEMGRAHFLVKGSTTGMLIVSVKAVNHGFLVSVRVFTTKGHFYLADQVYVSFRVRFEELIKKLSLLFQSSIF